MDDNHETYQTYRMPPIEGQSPVDQEQTPDPFKNAQEYVGSTVEADNNHELLAKYAAEVSRNGEFMVDQLRHRQLFKDTGANVAGATDQTPFDHRRAA